MDELAKVRRVLGRLNPEAPHDVLLVLDATTGQNALAQIEVFRDVAGVTGLIMTKLDGTARGGVLVAAAEKFGLPIHAIGVGEGIDDLRPFDPRAVARAIAGLTRMTRRQARNPAAASRLLIDIGPLVVFFAANFLAPVPGPLKIFVATGAFMVAMIAAMLVSQLRYQHISPLLWFSGLMVVVLGGLTIWLHNETFIKIKPTIYYLFVAGLLGFGLATRRPFLKTVLGSAYPGLDERGLAQADAATGRCSSLVMAVVNESGLAQQLDRLLDRLQIVGHAPPHLPVRRRQRADADAATG